MNLLRKIATVAGLAAITTTGSLLTAGSANAVTWDPSCSQAGEAWIAAQSGSIYCYHDDGAGWANVNNVGDIGSGKYTAVFYLTYSGCNSCEWDLAPHVIEYPPSGTHIGTFNLYG